MNDPVLYSLDSLPIEFRAPKHEELVALYEQKWKPTIRFSRKQFRLSEKTNHEKCTCYICPCESSLGIFWSSGSATDKFLSESKKFKEQVQTKLKQVIVEEYLGEIPVGTAYLLQVTPTIFICFAILGMAKLEHFDSLSIYNGFRAALLEIRKHNIRTQLATAKQLKRAIPDRAVPAGGRPLSAGSPLRRSTTSVGNASIPALIEHVICPVFPNHTPSSVLANGDPASPLDVARGSVWQMFNAHQRCTREVSKTGFDVSNALVNSENQLCNRPVWNPEYEQSFFAALVVQQKLPKRGIYDLKELDFILRCISEGAESECVQYAQALADYLLQNSGNKAITEQHIREKVLKALKENKQAGAKKFLQFACEGKISIVPKISIEELEMQQVIATGATASVHKALYRGNPVAVKQFHEGVNMIEFNKEISIMSLLKNKNLVRLIGAGVQGSSAYMISELVPKGNLYNFLHENTNPLAQDVAINIMMDVCLGMEYLHSVGIVHRDLKSLNVLLGDKNQCKIADYGTSRFLDQSVQMTGNVGTGPWMAPEVFMNKNYSEKADIYSFGIMMYEILTKQHPFHDQPSFNIAIIVTKGGRPTIPKDMPKHWAKLMKDCWNEKPAKRPSFTKILRYIETLKGKK